MSLPQLVPAFLLVMDNLLAERQGFEPWEGDYPSTVFKTAAFDRSATSPSNYRVKDTRKTHKCKALRHPAMSKYILYQLDINNLLTYTSLYLLLNA
jgi:hypothetical protein